MNGSERPGRLPDYAGGRSFSASRRVRWGDVDVGGRLRLDGTARYLQDVSNEDTRDSGADPAEAWVVRRTIIDVEVPARGGEIVELTTFCGGLGSRWAERRTSIRGEFGARIEAMSLWIRVDEASGRPKRLDPGFLDRYAGFTGDRKVGASLTHGPPPVDAQVRPWPLRSTDFDPLNHVNNAATWEPVEDELARRGVRPLRAALEYGASLDPGDEPDLMSVLDDGVLRLWVVVAGAVRASGVVHLRPS